jgi:hypothetical protein
MLGSLLFEKMIPAVRCAEKHRGAGLILEAII